VSKESNEIIYNKLIKRVCLKSRITDKVEAQIKNKNTNRIEIKTLPKYHFVTSHIGRRSFATNYYGKINTSLLISATGHASEKQFLAYVGSAPKQNAQELAKAMRSLSISENTPMRVIKKTVNE
jgi:integrase